jgi:hypothetical protein
LRSFHPIAWAWPINTSAIGSKNNLNIFMLLDPFKELAKFQKLIF